MPAEIRKLLIIRLSSIGDIVLTTPVIRSLRNCLPDTEIHFITKAAFVPLLAHHPALAKVHAFEGDMNATVAELRAENFDFVMDLHRNIRSRIIRTRLGKPSAVYSKDRWAVWKYTKFRWGKLPDVHTVERYARTLPALNCALDEGGLEMFVREEIMEAGKKEIEAHFEQEPVTVVLGGKWQTKKWPTEYFRDLLNALGLPVLLLGGKAEMEEGKWLENALEVRVLNRIGEVGLLESAALMAASGLVLTHDTGLMHIGVALGKQIVSLWGNTVPELGFSPYKAPNALILQNTELSCRPCHKIGYDTCPKKHFRCMRDLTPEIVLPQIRAVLNPE
ncbi:MAG: glycosyltransferase family 9 protein [Bacteroidota bacterium]